MKRPVIAIGLDAAATSLIDRWSADGSLPTLARLRAEGASARLRGNDHHRAETAWTTLLTGCRPGRVGYWTPIAFREGSYDVELVDAYDFEEFPPFYAVGSDYRVAIVDVPQTRLRDDVEGLQVLAWGAHSPQGPTVSQPAELLSELHERYGPHPRLHTDSCHIFDAAALKSLQQGLEIGIGRRAAMCRDLLGRGPWDLFFTVFGESHSGAHCLWHLSDPEHPLHSVLAPHCGDLLRELFVALDRSVGSILAAAPPDAYTVVFSSHGMVANVLDLNSLVFLPELLFRFSFPGRAAIAPGRPGTPPPPQILGHRLVDEGWARTLWSLTREPSSIGSFLKRRLPDRYYARLAPLFDAPAGDVPESPFRLFERGMPESFQPPTWFRHLWPRMQAFALPSFSEGYIRINLEGREPTGTVPPRDYERVCDRLEEMLHRVVDARTGAPLVEKVVRTRSSADDRDPRLPAADLVVLWREQPPVDVVDSPDLGRVGPVPFLRSGGHVSDGLLLLRGPGIEPGSELPEARNVDLAPTLLRLMSAPIPDLLEGRPLLGPE